MANDCFSDSRGAATCRMGHPTIGCGRLLAQSTERSSSGAQARCRFRLGWARTLEATRRMRSPRRIGDGAETDRLSSRKLWA